MPPETFAASDCPFCAYLDGRTPCAFVSRERTVSAFLNRTQYERGALLVVPNTHVATVMEAPKELVSDVHVAARRLAIRLTEALGATGVNIFQNNGAPAGQTVAHYHVHVVPRYQGSDPAQRFRERDFDHTPLEVLQDLAEKLSGEW